MEKLRTHLYLEDIPHISLKDQPNCVGSHFYYTEFPDKSLKVYGHGLENFSHLTIETKFLDPGKSLILLGLLKQLCDSHNITVDLDIKYLAYQQDDRNFSSTESFGLKFLASMINSMNFRNIRVLTPHSDKFELINNATSVQPTKVFHTFLENFKKLYGEFPVIVYPDAGAYKNLRVFSQHQNGDLDYISASKFRKEGELHGEIHIPEAFKGRKFLIVDDLLLGGATALSVANLIKGAFPEDEVPVSGFFVHGLLNSVRSYEKLFTTFNEIHITDSCAGKHYEVGHLWEALQANDYGTELVPTGIPYSNLFIHQFEFDYAK